MSTVNLQRRLQEVMGGVSDTPSVQEHAHNPKERLKEAGKNKGKKQECIGIKKYNIK
jgi:hypothetical protein